MKHLTVRSSSIVHKNPWYFIRRDEVVFPNGKPGEYFVAEFPGSAFVICIDNGKILTTKQYRHPTKTESLEFPGGGLKNNDPLETAKAELIEETGYTADTWTKLGVLSVMNGVCNMQLHVFAAEQVHRGEARLEASEEGMTTHWIPIDEWRMMIRNGKITDSESIAAWSMYREWKGF